MTPATTMLDRHHAHEQGHPVQAMGTIVGGTRVRGFALD
jgi:hypothetical protein